MAKEFHWKGKTEDELKRMDLKDFAKLLPARARRSLTRGFTIQQKKVLKKVYANDPAIKTQCRDLVIIPSMIGKTIRVHSGKEYQMIIITAEMLGHTLGEFAPTRKSVSHSAAGIGATRSSKAVSAR